MAEVDVRKGMPSSRLSRAECERRYRSRFADPAFAPLQRERDAIIAAAWDGYGHSRKAPLTRKAGPGFADPDYDIAVDWRATPFSPRNDTTTTTQQRRSTMSKDPVKGKPAPQQGIIRDERGEEQPADKERAQHVSRKDKGDDPPGQK